MPIWGPLSWRRPWPRVSAYLSRVGIPLLALGSPHVLRAFKRRYEYNHLRNLRKEPAEKKIPSSDGTLGALVFLCRLCQGHGPLLTLNESAKAVRATGTSFHCRSFDIIILTLSVMSV